MTGEARSTDVAGADATVAGTMGARIEARLREAFRPARLEVIDESHLHVGHAGNDGRGESHYRVRIRAPAFAGLDRVATHRAINRALAEELRTVHALAIDAAGSDEMGGSKGTSAVT